MFLLVYDNIFVPMIFSVLEISMKRVVSNVCEFNMLSFVSIGFLIQFARFVQCLVAVNTDQNSSADKLVFVHGVNKQTVRLISFQIYQLKFLQFSILKQTEQLCRHAERSIIETFPNDPYKGTCVSYYNIKAIKPYRQLTNVNCF